LLLNQTFRRADFRSTRSTLMIRIVIAGQKVRKHRLDAK